MYKRSIIAILIVCVVLIGLGGCKKKTSEEADIVKTDAEYKAQAEKEITSENMFDELDKLEKSIDQDEAEL